MLALIHEHSVLGKKATKREIFYSGVNLFRKQTKSDAIVDNLAATLKIARSQLSIVRSFLRTCPENCNSNLEIVRCS